MTDLINLISSGWLYFACSIYLLLLSEMYAGFNFSRGVLRSSLLITLLVVLIFAASNSSYGFDRDVYLSFYQSVASAGWDGGTQVELLFRVLLVLVIFVGLKFEIFMVSMTFLSLIIKFKAASSFEINPFCFCFALFSFFFLDIFFVRQLLAASFFFIAVIALERGSSARYFWWFVMFLSITIHASAALPIACYVAYSLRKRPLTLAAFAVAGLGTMALSYEILLPKMLDQINIYGADEFNQIVDSSFSGVARNVIKNLILILISYFCVYVAKNNKRSVSKEIGKNLLAVITIISVLSLILSQILSPVFQRLSLYIFPFVALLFASTYSSGSLKTSVGIRAIAIMLVLYLIPILEGYSSLLL